MVLKRLLNPKGHKEDLKIKKLQATISSTGGGRSGAKRRSDARRELANLTSAKYEEKNTTTNGGAKGQGNQSIANNPNRGGGKTSTTSTKSTKSRVIKGTPGSSKGAMAAKAMAKKRIAEGKSTLGEFTGPDRGKKAAQAAAKARIKAGKSTVTGKTKKTKEDEEPKYNRRGRRIN